MNIFERQPRTCDVDGPLSQARCLREGWDSHLGVEHAAGARKKGVSKYQANQGEITTPCYQAARSSAAGRHDFTTAVVLLA